MTKRNKKYNPNKLAQIHAAKFAKHQARWKQINVLYQFEMEFVVEHVNNKLDDFAKANGLGPNDYLPSHAVIEVYEEQDMIIALKQQLIKEPESWEIGIDSHFYNAETDEIKTIPFFLNLPSMSHEELMAGCDKKVHFIDGIKTVKDKWEGLQNEMIKNWEKEGVPEGFELTMSQVKMIAQAKFRDIEKYDRFCSYLNFRDDGKLIDVLKAEDSLSVKINALGSAA